MFSKMKKGTKIGLIFIFILLLAVNVFIAYSRYYQNVYYDSSPELELAELLAKENRVMTDSWFYSTEIRVLYTQLVNGLLFQIITDWRIVNVLSLLIHMLIMELALYYVFHKVLNKRNTFCYWLTAIWLLIPFTWIWRLYVLNGMFYIPHFIVMLLAVGCFLSTVHKISQVEKFTFKNLCPVIVLVIAQAILAFLAGLGGIRHLEITYLPIFATAVILFFCGKYRKKVIIPVALMVIWVTAASGIGYIVNSKVLVNLFDFGNYNDIKIVGFSFSRLENIVSCINQNFGLVTGIRLFSFSGLASVLSFVIWIIAAVMIVTVIRNFKNLCLEEQILYLFTALNWSLNFFVLLFTDNAIEARYFLPQVFWLAICIAVFFRRCLKDNPFHLQRGFLTGISILLILFILFESANGYRDWLKEDKNSSGLREAVDYLMENDYTFGYSEFYTGGVIPALSNGEIEMCWVKDFESFEPNPWLMEKSSAERKDGEDKTFILLTADQYHEAEEQNYISQGNLIRVTDDYLLIVYPSLSDLWNSLSET